MLAKQIDRQYTDISLDNSSPPTSSSLNTGQSDMESDYSEVEPFESEYSMLNNMIIEGFSDNENSNDEQSQEEIRMNQIKDVEVSPTYEAPSYNENENENEIQNGEEAIKNNNENSNINKLNNNIKKLKKAKKNNNKNFLDKLLTLGNSKNREDETSDEDSDSEDEEDIKLSYIDKDGDIDYKLNTLNRNVNLLIRKMNDSQLFEDESQDNIHDLILFILFGIFIIFVLDTIYRFGKSNTSK